MPGALQVGCRSIPKWFPRLRMLAATRPVRRAGPRRRARYGLAGPLSFPGGAFAPAGPPHQYDGGRRRFPAARHFAGLGDRPRSLSEHASDSFGHRGSDRDELCAGRRCSHVARRDDHPGMRDWDRRDGNVHGYGQRKQLPGDCSVRRLRDRDQRSMDAWGRGEDRPDGWTGGNGAGNPPARVPCDICCIVLYDGACLLDGVYSS